MKSNPFPQKRNVSFLLLSTISLLLFGCERTVTQHCPGGTPDRLPIAQYPEGGSVIFESVSGAQITVHVNGLQFDEARQFTCTQKKGLFGSYYDDDGCYAGCTSAVSEIQSSNNVPGVNRFDLTYRHFVHPASYEDNLRSVYVNIGSRSWKVLIDPMEAEKERDTVYSEITLGSHSYKNVLKIVPQDVPLMEEPVDYIYYERHLGVVGFKFAAKEEAYYLK